jgi:hypothetical protein
MVRKTTTQSVTFTPSTTKARIHPSIKPRKAAKPVVEQVIDPFPQAVPIVETTPPPKIRMRSAPGVHNPEALTKSRRAAADYAAQQSQERRDIAPINIDSINWDRRLSCMHDLNLFERTYLPDTFNYGFSKDQLICNEQLTQCIVESGSFAIAMPRGGGKSTLCRGSIAWAAVNGFKKYMVFVGANDGMALKSFKMLKLWLSMPNLVEDFPEVCYPIFRLGNNVYLSRGQIYDGLSTYIEWGDNGKATFPSITLPEDMAAVYNKHLPGFLVPVEVIVDPIKMTKETRWLPKSAGTIFETYGIDASIRGTAIGQQYTGRTLRPDLVLLDDVQRETNLDSETAFERLVNQIEGSIQGLAGPDTTLSVLMACTIQKEDDVSSLFTDPEKKPDYMGKRFPLVNSWPEGITDYEITLETEAGRLWNTYQELRKESLATKKNISIARDFYLKNRKVMDAGFECSWEDRYGDRKIHASPQHFAMEQRFKLEASFPFEMQNRPRRLTGLIDIIDAKQLRERVTSLPRGILPRDANILVAHIDVGNEIMYYTVMAVNHDFSGAIIDYGTWPEVPSKFFKNYQADGWSKISTAFFEKYPDQLKNATKTESGRPRAPVQAKIYFALQKTVNHLLSKHYFRDDPGRTLVPIQRIGIDTKWGAVNESAKQFIRESRVSNLIAYQGASFPPTRRQLENYNLVKGWLFEHQKHPTVKESKWVWRPTEQAMDWYLQCDVDRQKEFLFQRLASPVGTPGSILLFDAPPEQHDLFAAHVCNSEYPEPLATPVLVKNMYIERPGFDNDFLDAATACITLASYQGACLKITDTPLAIRKRKSMKEKLAQMQGR